MSHIIFYTKPGCLGGIKQKAVLIASGHTVEERSSLETPWTPEVLRSYFGQLPVSEWYNPNAPDVKSGKVVPGALPEQETLDLFCRQPILIKRPLMQIGNKKMVGFVIEELKQIIPLENIPDENLNACQMTVTNEICQVKQE